MVKRGADTIKYKRISTLKIGRYYYGLGKCIIQRRLVWKRMIRK